MNEVATGLNSTLEDLKHEVETHESIVGDARIFVGDTKSALQESQTALTALKVAEDEKRREHDKFAQFLGGEPNHGTPAMRATLDRLNEELTGVTRLSGRRRACG